MSSSVKIASRDGGDQSNNDRRNSTDDERPDPSSIKLPQTMMGVGNAVTAMSAVVAVGVNSEDGLKADEDSDDEEEDDDDNNETPWRDDRTKSSHKKHVKFRDEQLEVEFNDKDLWRKDTKETVKDMMEHYQRECIVNRVKPIQILLDQLKGLYSLDDPIDTIDLTGVKLDSKTCEALESILSRIHSNTLKLERTSLEDEGIIALCEMVEFYGCATRLLLAHNNKLRPRAWLTIGRTLKKSPFLHTIDVSYCALDEQTLTLLLRSVRANCGLRVLRIEGNHLSGKGTFIMMAAMKFNENLQELYLARNHLVPEDGQHLGSILRTNKTLRVLDVSDNNLQDPGIRYICAGIAEQQEGLVVLTAHTNNLTHDGIHHISAMLPCTRTLRELNVSNNKFGDNGLFMLKLGLLANRSVDRLFLSGSRVTCEGAIALAEVLAESKFISHVDLRENDIRIAGLMALKLALRMNHRLLLLDMPKTYKVDQRDRQLIKELLAEMDGYRSRNHKEKEEREKKQNQLQQQQQREEQQQQPPQQQVVDEDDEEKEVDPSLVGSLDNVYNEETAAAMMKEDPFKRAPVMDKGSATPAEMEKTVDALIVYETEGGSNECLSPRESCSSPDGSLSPVSPRPGEGMELDLLTAGASGEGSSGSSHQQPLSSTVEQLPDIVDISSSANQPLAPAAVRASQLTTNNSPPDIAAQSRDLPPDLGAESRTPLDLLSPEGGGDALLVDLTEGAPSSDQASRQTPT